jgi:glucan phosphoethanolaminetransferase (alkaline phosphatase superfamily)
MRAVSLLAVLLLAHVLILIGHTVPVSPWTPLVLFWQDVLLVVVFAGLDLVIKRAWFGWTLYTLIVLYVALNVPLTRILSTPLTWTMARAARGPLAGSIWYYVSWQNCLWMAGVLASALAWPVWCLARPGRHPSQPEIGWGDLPLGWRLAVLISSVAVIAFGLYGTRRVETVGLHRNPVITLVTSAFPHVAARSAQQAWRASPLEGPKLAEDLTRWRAACSGRNVILILLESTGAGYLHLYGAGEDPTPNLTGLGPESILFENAYSVYPESIKGLFSVLCSQYPSFDSKPNDYARWRVPSLAQVLATHGYRTALFHSGRFMYLGMESIVRNRGYSRLEDAGDIGGEDESSFGVGEPAAIKRILQWVDAQPAGARFFITYLPVAGHHPYESPEGGPFSDADDLGHYRNALHYGDAALGGLIRGLRRRKLLENTLLVFCGDHGEAFGQHPGNFGHTLFIYEENVHVPLLLVAPGLFRPPVRVKRAASLIDITPTILDLLGINEPHPYQGRSLLTGQEQMALFYTDYSLGLMGLRDGRWKFIHELDSGLCQLFDLSADPAERTNLSARFPVRTAAYRQLLRGWSAAQKQRFNTATAK